MVQGKEPKITTVKKLIDGKLLKISQEDLYGKWSGDNSSPEGEDDEEMELNEKERIKIEKVKKKLMGGTADFTRSWKPNGIGPIRKLEKKSRIRPKRSIKPRFESASSMEEGNAELSDNK